MHRRTDQPRLAGREAAHLLRVLSIARQRQLPLLPAIAAAADLDSLPQLRRFAVSLEGHGEEELTASLGRALAAGQDAPAAAMLAALERVGLPADGLRELARWLSDRAAYRQRFFRAVAYPFTLMITGALVFVVAFHGFAMPVLMETFASLFSELGSRLPLLTRAYLAFYRLPLVMWGSPVGVVAYLLAVLAACFGCLRFGLRFSSSTLALYLPFTRQYIRFDAARSFTDALALLLAQQVELVDGLRLASLAVEHPAIRQRLEPVVQRVEAGEGLGECLRESAALPSILSWRVWSAYYRSQLEEELVRVAASCDRELEAWEVRVLGATKVVVFVVAAVVLSPVILAVVAMYLPMFSLISQIG